MATEQPPPPQPPPEPARRAPQARWLDAEAGPVVRPFFVTRGRARPVTGDYDLVAFVVAEAPPTVELPEHFQPEHRDILALTQEPATVADIAAALRLPVGAVRVLLGDLAQDRLVSLHHSAAGGQHNDDNVLKAVISGLRAL